MQQKICANCNSKVSGSDFHCAVCGSTNLTVLHPPRLGLPQEPKNIEYYFVESEPKFLDSADMLQGSTDAPRWLRLAGAALDGFLSSISFGVGWFIWLCFIANKGLTPAKQILGMRIVDVQGGFPAPGWRVFLRHYLPLVIGIFLAPFSILGWFSLPYAFAFLLGALQVASFVIPLVDSLFIFGPRRQRLMDIFFSTRVVRG